MGEYLIMKHILVLCITLSPAIAWAAYKPMRVLAPGLVSGVTCMTDTICIDDVSRYPEALKLYDEAVYFVAENIEELKVKPRVTFCSSLSCFRSFGFNQASAKTVGKSGIVISPKGWKYHYLRHEIIHHLQAEKLGVIAQWRSPEWYKEGMAYYLSQDPRNELSGKYQQYRTQFAQWFKRSGKDNIWDISAIQ